MSFLSIGDLAQSFQTRRLTTMLKTELSRHGQELTTGRIADPSRALRGDFTALSGIELGSGRLAAFNGAIKETAIHATGLQNRLSALMEDGAHAARQLSATFDGAPPGIVDGIATTGRSAFAAAVSALNAHVADRAIFAGKATGGPAVITDAEMLAALANDTAGATTAAELEAAVADWFETPVGGFMTQAYLGSGTEIGPVSLSPEDDVTLPGSASSPEIRSHLVGLAMAALIDEGALSGDGRERAETLRRAGRRLTEAQPGLARVSAEVGATEARIDRLATRNAAESAALELARHELVGVDPFDAAMRLEETRVRIETMFAVTARLSRLSLAEHLR